MSGNQHYSLNIRSWSFRTEIRRNYFTGEFWIFEIHYSGGLLRLSCEVYSKQTFKGIKEYQRIQVSGAEVQDQPWSLQMWEHMQETKWPAPSAISYVLVGCSKNVPRKCANPKPLRFHSTDRCKSGDLKSINKNEFCLQILFYQILFKVLPSKLIKTFGTFRFQLNW